MRRAIAPGVLLAGAAAIAAAPVAAGHVPSAVRTPQKKKVIVADDYYGPSKLTVNRGSTITWVWPYDNSNTHDVKTAKRPKGAKFFHSDPAAAGFRFTRRLTVPGTYRIVCTLHVTMTMTITVRR